MKPLSLTETRVIGSLIEKSLTTPDQYPLSLNALTNACNQKSNRDPVLDLAEATVKSVTEGLVDAGLVTEVSGWGSRVVKYKHRFCNTEFSDLQLNDQELAIICVLFLRGAQTPGELRSRTSRLCEFGDVLDVEKALHRMISREQGPLIRKLEREPGRRESRYQHLLGDESLAAAAASPRTTDRVVPAGDPDQITQLLDRMSALEQEVEDLKELVNTLLN